jgi:hypothetical protein
MLAPLVGDPDAPVSSSERARKVPSSPIAIGPRRREAPCGEVIPSEVRSQPARLRRGGGAQRDLRRRGGATVALDGVVVEDAQSGIAASYGAEVNASDVLVRRVGVPALYVGPGAGSFDDVRIADTRNGALWAEGTYTASDLVLSGADGMELITASGLAPALENLENQVPLLVLGMHGRAPRRTSAMMRPPGLLDRAVGCQSGRRKRGTHEPLTLLLASRDRDWLHWEHDLGERRRGLHRLRRNGHRRW